MPTLSDRMARRLQNAKEFREEFWADVGNGRRNIFGFRNQKWYEYEDELRRKRHEDRQNKNHPRHLKDKDSSDGQDRSNDRDTQHDRDNSRDGESEHGRSSQYANKSGRHGRNEDAGDKGRGHGREHRKDRTRNQHFNHHGSSRGYRPGNDSGGRSKERSKRLHRPQPHPGALEIILDIAGKVIQELLGGAPQQLIEDHRHQRHRSRTPERITGERGQQEHGTPRPPQSEPQGYDNRHSPDFPQPRQQPHAMPPKHPSPSQESPNEREDRHHSRASNGAPLETNGSQHGVPLEPPQTHGEAEGYYEGHPLQNQQASGGPSHDPASNKQRERGPRLGNPKAQPQYHEEDPFGDDQGSYEDDSGSHEDSRRLRKPKTSATGLASSTRRGVPPAAPNTLPVRDFGGSLGTGKSSQNTATSASVGGDFDRDDEVDSSSITSESSSMATEQPAHARGKHSKNGNFERGGGQHHEDIENADNAHSESEGMHVRGGGGGDDDEDENSNASYNEYEKFDDEYPCDEAEGSAFEPCRPEKNGANIAQPTPRIPLKDGQGRYRSLSYVDAKLESERLKPSSYDDQQARCGRYRSRSYVDAKLESERRDSFPADNAEPRRYRYSSQSYVDAKARVTGKVEISYTTAESANGVYIPSLHGAAKAKTSEFQYTPLGRTLRTYDASGDDKSGRSPSPKPYKSRINPRASQAYVNEPGRSRESEPSRARSKHVRFEERSESPPSRPEYPPLRPEAPPKPQGQKRYHAPAVIEEPPPDHYATLEISAPTTPENIAIIARKLRIKVHPDMLKRKNPDMSENEKTAIDERAKKVGEAAEVLLDSSMCAEYHQEIRNWEAKYGRLLWARSLKI